MSSDLSGRPQYGEYASPEEQRARIQQPDATWALATGQAPGTEAPLEVTPPVRERSSSARFADRVASFALLGYGAFTVITSIPALIDYAAYASTLIGMLGVDAELTDPLGARGWGVAAAVVLALGWLLTAALVWRRMRAERSSWWIALLAGIVFNTLAGVIGLIPIMSDTQLWQQILQSVG